MAGTLTRWDPFSELRELRSRFDRLFDDWPDGHERAWTPAIDVVREEDHLVLRADLPGIKPEEVKIEAEDDILRVSGEHRESMEEPRAGCDSPRRARAAPGIGPTGGVWRAKLTPCR